MRPIRIRRFEGSVRPASPLQAVTENDQKGLGIAAGYMSVLVLALYINSPAISSLYRHPQLIWPLCGLMLYWISRVWMKAHRGRMHDDPVIFAMRDRVSLAVGLLAAAVVYAAT